MSILQPIKPQYCELIASGKKTIEVRKTRPKCELPVKVYIYETKDKKYMNMAIYEPKNNIKFEHTPGKVIAEYICDEIIEWTEDMKPPVPLDKIQLSYSKIRQYGGDKTLYLWHISDLKIYDKPKELSEFYKSCGTQNCCDCQFWFNNGEYAACEIRPMRQLKRPPQSWCYVEEV